MSGPVVGGGLGLGGLLIYLVYALLGGNPADLQGQLGTQGGGGKVQSRAIDPEAKEFVGVVLADTEDVWTEEFRKRGRSYKAPKLVMFSGSVDSACGMASSAMGPFYCPEDQQVYIDVAFYEELKNRFGAPGDFAQAYVIAHEVGHHVQKLLGISDKVQAMRERMSQSQFNQISVRMELQADFFAGVWARKAQQMASLDKQDLEEALNAANAIGDDTLQRETQGRVVPDSFTHGTSEQRVRWFLKGWETGDMMQGDTFSANRL